MRFKCKRCGKVVTVDSEDTKEISCQNCGTIHAWLCDDGWGYYGKDFMKKKCPICKGNVFVKRDLLSIDNGFLKICCDSCDKELLLKKEYNKVSLFPFKTLFFSCEWCGEQLECSVENVSLEYIEKQNDAHSRYIEIIKCEKCSNRTKVEFIPYWDDKFYTEKILKSGRKKKIKNGVIDDFIHNNYIYNRYGLLHPYNIIDFCDDAHYDFEQVWDYIVGKKSEIFIPMSREEVKALKVKKYEKQFDNLILKENAMKDAGGASLSRLLGQRKVWKNLRSLLITQNNSKCKICGQKKENTRSLHIHENWKVEKNIVELTDIELICADCHACKHRNQFAVYRVMEGASGLVYGIPRADFLTIHLMRVNNVTKEVIYAYRKELLKELDEFEKQRIRNYNFESKDEEIEYKYVIDENIPLKEEIEAVLREKQLLLQKEK